MRKFMTRMALIALVALIVPVAMPGAASAQMREFVGKVDKIDDKKLIVDNRKGDKVSFDKVAETTVEGTKTGLGRHQEGRLGERVLEDGRQAAQGLQGQRDAAQGRGGRGRVARGPTILLCVCSRLPALRARGPACFGAPVAARGRSDSVSA